MDGQDTDIATGLSTCITKDGQQTLTANIPFAGYRLTGLGAVVARTDAMRASHEQDQDLVYFPTGGVADALTLMPVPAVTSYTPGQTWKIKISVANLTTTPTIAVNGLAAKTIVNASGSALVAGDLALGGVYEITYESTAGQFFLINKVSPYVLPSQPTLQLTDGGVQAGNFNAAVNTKYWMKANAVANTATLPNKAGSAAKNIIALFVQGIYGAYVAGTVNGAYNAGYFLTGQTNYMLSYTPTVGWN